MQTGRAGAEARWRWWSVALLLVASGFSALVYQTLWLRLLGIVFGVTVHAASTVLASFMAGLALGSFAAGRVADRVASPLRWFGATELLIGISALATPALLALLETVYPQVHPLLPDGVAAITAVRLVWSFAVLLVPTTLMGATMTLAVRAVADTASPIGSRAAALYAANTVGAVFGAVITGYILMGQFGITNSFRIAAAMNIAAGAAAIVLSGRLRSKATVGLASIGAWTEAPRAMNVPLGTRRLVLAVSALSGFVALALEIVWFRALVMFLPATTYVFTIILAVVLGGIAVGSAFVTPMLRRDGDWVARLAVLQTALAVAAVGSLAAQAWTYAHGWRTGAALQAAGLSVLPSALLMGAAFPVGLACWTAGNGRFGRDVGARVGTFYTVNLSGAIAGAIVAGFILIPWLGTQRALVAVASISLAAGLVLLCAVARRRPPFAVTASGVAVLVFTGLAILLPDPLETVLARRYGGERLLWREEGAQATVSVNAGEHRVMYLDGLHQANDSPEMLATHRQIGTLAMALHPGPRDALVIGLGGGATAGAVAQFSDAAVDVIELVPGVVHGAEWFRHANGDVLRRPNVRVRIDDGRNYLLLAGRRYDVITADIIQPFHAGAGNLYSVEYFQLAARALRDDGVMLQWIGQRPATQYALIARTFLTVFPHATAWAGGTLLAGSTQPLRLSRSQYVRRLMEPTFARALGAMGIASFEDLLRWYSGGPGELRAFVGEGPVLTDDRPLVEYFLSLPRDERQVDLSGLAGDVRRHVMP